MKRPFDKPFDRLRKFSGQASRTCPRWLSGRPKRDTYPGYVVKRDVVTTRMDTGVKQRPKVTIHQSVERSNPLAALSPESKD